MSSDSALDLDMTRGTNSFEPLLAALFSADDVFTRFSTFYSRQFGHTLPSALLGPRKSRFIAERFVLMRHILLSLLMDSEVISQSVGRLECPTVTFRMRTDRRMIVMQVLLKCTPSRKRGHSFVRQIRACISCCYISISLLQKS